MRILVLGANGRTGRQLLTRALEEGDVVTALVRDADRVSDLRAEGLTMRIGSATDPEILASLVPGHDVVISALGPRRPTKVACAVYPDSAAAIVKAMERSAVTRLLVTSTALLFPKQGLLGHTLRLFLPSTIGAATRMEERIRASSLDWTIARTGFLTNKNASDYRLSDSSGGTVSRASLANFLWTEAKHCKHIRETVGLFAK